MPDPQTDQPAFHIGIAMAGLFRPAPTRLASLIS
jgi:hypothetical protein